MAENKFALLTSRTAGEHATAEPETPQAKRRPGRPHGRRSDLTYVQTTAYIERETHKRTMYHLNKNKYMLDSTEDYSSLINRLLTEWLATQQD